MLDKILLDIVKNVDDDSDEMWKRLDEKYEKPSKLADVVMYDIEELRAIREGDDKRFIDLVDMIEKGCHDLLRVGIEQEIIKLEYCKHNLRETAQGYQKGVVQRGQQN